MNKAYLIVAIIAISILLFINNVLEDPKFESVKEELNFLVSAKQYEDAEKLYIKLLNTECENIDLHYNYIQNHFKLPEKKDKNHYRDDAKVIDYYFKLSNSQKDSISDIGNYGTGLYFSKKNEYDIALGYYNSIKNKNLKYLNNSLGFVSEKNDDFKNAEGYYRKEIDNKGNLDGAYSNLFNLLAKQKRFTELKEFLENDSTKEYVSNSTTRKIYFYNHNFISYFQLILLKPIEHGKNYLAFFSALFILLCYLIYLKKVDVFEPEKWYQIAVIFSLGAIFCNFVYPLSDFIDIYLNFRLNDKLTELSVNWLTK